MPPAVYTAGAELKIELDGVGLAHQPCQPGSVITGRVVRTAPDVSPRATVSIRLLGRAKTKITVTRSNGQSTSKSHYRNRFNFFEPNQTRQLLLDGPLHIALGAREPASWPFAIDMPLHPSPVALRSEGATADTCFMSLRSEDIASSPLPASFAAQGRHRNVRFEAYVEYQLEAVLVTSGSKGKEVTAVLPLQMRTPGLPHPLSDFAIRRRSMMSMVSTYRLVPGMENAELSFKQKTKQVFGSSKVPMFGFVILVDCPSVIQLGNPAPIPFSIRILPDKRRTSEVIHDVEQTVSLTSLQIVLKAHTAVIAPTTFSSQKTDDTLKHNISLPVTALGRTMNPPVETETPPDGKGNVQSPAGVQRSYGLTLPSKWQAGDETALNIGAAVDFRLLSTHATAFGQTISNSNMGSPITPGFETYCIRHSHSLKWKAFLEIAGKAENHEGEQAITIVGPSELPPPPTAAPQQAGADFEQLPSYGASAQVAGPSNHAEAVDAPVEELPLYSK